MSDPIASIYLRVQSFWFGARSKPGLQSQATPPLGVSRQMWAQPWSLFMQFIPSGKRQTREGLGIRRKRENFRLKRGHETSRSHGVYGAIQTEGLWGQTTDMVPRSGARPHSESRTGTGREAPIGSRWCPSGFRQCPH